MSDYIEVATMEIVATMARRRSYKTGVQRITTLVIV